MLSSRNARSNKSRHIRRYLHITVYTKPRKLCTEDGAGFRREDSLRHGETIDISSPSPNSLSIKRCEVHTICDIKLEHCEGRPRILISQLNSSYLCLFFSHMTRIALVYTLPGDPFCFNFFPTDFCQSRPSFFLKAINFLPLKKIRWSLRRSFRFALRNIRIFRSNIANLSRENAGKYRSSITAGPARKEVGLAFTGNEEIRKRCIIACC